MDWLLFGRNEQEIEVHLPYFIDHLTREADDLETHGLHGRRPGIFGRVGFPMAALEAIDLVEAQFGVTSNNLRLLAGRVESILDNEHLPEVANDDFKSVLLERLDRAWHDGVPFSVTVDLIYELSHLSVLQCFIRYGERKWPQFHWRTQVAPRVERIRSLFFDGLLPADSVDPLPWVWPAFEAINYEWLPDEFWWHHVERPSDS